MRGFPDRDNCCYCNLPMRDEGMPSRPCRGQDQGSCRTAAETVGWLRQKFAPKARHEPPHGGE